ncbi:ABC transporter substrate-binding protein [Chitinilyticum litopenaei]|uniref:ABC transporter substrate-binding protein n=1 Tax=Chitinilyticum litopenaei TaxID=1121276 RepID=UPI000425DCD7|nr:sugar ABC transporter substrate-binding protein [Chitinilyticum litopenaei]
MKHPRQFATCLPLIALLASGLAHAQKTPVEFWTFNLASFAPYFEESVKQFNASNPDLEAKWVDMNWDQIQPKLITAMAAGTPPALVNFNVPWTHEFARKGSIQPLDKLVGAQRKVYLPVALNDLTVNQQLYGLPFYNSVSVIAYNKDVFGKAGISSQPQNFEQFIAQAKQIKAKTGVAAFSPKLATKSGDGGMLRWFMYLGLPIVDKGQAVFTGPEHVKAVEQFAELYRSGVIPKDSFRLEYEQEIAAYTSGRLAMMTTSPTALKRVEIDNNAVYNKTDVMPFPVAGGKMAMGAWLMSFVVPKNYAKPEAAVKLGLFLTSDERQLAYARTTETTFPSTAQALQDKYFTAGATSKAPVERARAAAAQSMQYARTPMLPPGALPDETTMMKQFNDQMQLAIEGRKPARAALEEAARMWNARLTKVAAK